MIVRRTIHDIVLSTQYREMSKYRQCNGCRRIYEVRFY